MTTNENGKVEHLRSADEVVLRDIWYAHVLADRGECWPVKTTHQTMKPSIELER